jgi:hypothetical protein
MGSCAEPAERGDSLKPGVERGFASGTPGSLEYQVAARGVGDSLFIISDLRRLLYRTLRALEFHNRRNLGLRSAPPQALRYRPAPRANPNQTADQRNQSFL